MLRIFMFVLLMDQVWMAQTFFNSFGSCIFQLKIQRKILKQDIGSSKLFKSNKKKIKAIKS